MTDRPRVLATRAGEMALPCYVPMTLLGETSRLPTPPDGEKPGTFAARHVAPVEDRLRPYLPRLCPAQAAGPRDAPRLASSPGHPPAPGRLPLIVVPYGPGPADANPPRRAPADRALDWIEALERTADVGLTPPVPALFPSGARRILENRRRRDLPLFFAVSPRHAGMLATPEARGFEGGAVVAERSVSPRTVARARRALGGNRPLLVVSPTLANRNTEAQSAPGLAPLLWRELARAGADVVVSREHARTTPPGPGETEDPLLAAIARLSRACASPLPLSAFGPIVRGPYGPEMPPPISAP